MRMKIPVYIILANCLSWTLKSLQESAESMNEQRLLISAGLLDGIIGLVVAQGCDKPRADIAIH